MQEIISGQNANFQLIASKGLHFFSSSTALCDDERKVCLMSQKTEFSRKHFHNLQLTLLSFASQLSYSCIQN